MLADMQDSLSFFLALLVAHLAGDFLFQTDCLVEGKAKCEPAAYLRHGAVHGLLAYGAVLAFTPTYLAKMALHLAVFAVVLTHLGIDYLKGRLDSESKTPRWLSFLADQALHVALLLIVSCLAFADSRCWVVEIYQGFGQYRIKILWLIAIYLATIFGGGFLIRLLLPRQEQGVETLGEQDRALTEEEKRLGMYIGWLERFLVLSAILGKSFTAAGLILAAKSVVRFKKLENEKFAEYFLLGTFLSLLLAITGGLLLRWLLWGTLDLE